MSTSQLRDRVAALRAEAAAVGQQLAAQGAGMGPEELFEVTGELQGVANAVEGAQLVAIAHAGCARDPADRARPGRRCTTRSGSSTR